MKWTILYINHKSEYYFKYQLKLLYGTNNPKDFEIVVLTTNKNSTIILKQAKLLKVKNIIISNEIEYLKSQVSNHAIKDFRCFV